MCGKECKCVKTQNLNVWLYKEEIPLKTLEVRCKNTSEVVLCWIFWMSNSLLLNSSIDPPQNYFDCSLCFTDCKQYFTVGVFGTWGFVYFCVFCESSVFQIAHKSVINTTLEKYTVFNGSRKKRGEGRRRMNEFWTAIIINVFYYSGHSGLIGFFRGLIQWQQWRCFNVFFYF